MFCEMADLGIINDQRNATDMWLNGILTSKSTDDYHSDEVKSHLEDFSLDDDLADKEELPNAMEFVSVECNMLFESDFNISSDHRFDDRSVRKRKHKSKKSKLKSKKKAVFPLLYPLPLISELFRYRSVDVYKRTCKDGPFVKIFTSEPLIEKSSYNYDEEAKVDNCDDDDLSAKKLKDQECDICGRQLIAQDLDAHIKQEHMQGHHYKCEVCQKKFTEKKYLITHRILHVNVVGKPYPCSLCKERFTNKTALKNHSHNHSGKEVQPEVFIQESQTASQCRSYDRERETNGVKKDYQCQHCQKSFLYKVQCTSHEKLHSGGVFMKCEDCDGTFTVKQMINHQRKHSKGKPYQCDKCSSAFRARSSLWSHKKSHIGQKPHECPDCGSMFWKSSSLKKHRKAHHE